jgi:hypothetical protein
LSLNASQTPKELRTLILGDRGETIHESHEASRNTPALTSDF